MRSPQCGHQIRAYDNVPVVSWLLLCGRCSPAHLPWLSARLLAKSGEGEKAILMWGQAYLAGDKYARKKAVQGLEEVLPQDKEARMKALAPLVDTMPTDELNQLIAEVFKDYTP